MHTEGRNKSISNTAEWSIMFELVRASVFNRTPLTDTNIEIDWDKLMDISIEQGVLPWVWDGICRLPVELQPNRTDKINWGLSAQEWISAYQHQKTVFAEVLNICKQKNIRVLLLKGFGLSEMYLNPQLRVSGDIDIFLFEDYQKGNELFSGGKYIHGGGDKHASFIYSGVTIENHHTLINTNTLQQKKVEAYLESALEESRLTKSGYYVLPPLPNLIFLIMHSLNHMESHISVTIRNLMDIAFFLNSKRLYISVAECQEVVHRLKIAKSFELLLSMAEEVSDLSFKEYHDNNIPRGDVQKAFMMLAEQDASIEISFDLPLFTQIRQRKHYYDKMRWKYKYLPLSRIDVFSKIYKLPISHFVHKLFRFK